MKSTVETKVAAAIAVSFVALTFGVVAQETSQGRTQQPGQKSSTSHRELSRASRPGSGGSFAGRQSVQERNLEPLDISREMSAAKVAQSDC
jgi:hypothetical protein